MSTAPTIIIAPEHHEAGEIRIEPWPHGGGVTLIAIDPHGLHGPIQMGVTTNEAIKVAQALITAAWRMGGQGTIS